MTWFLQSISSYFFQGGLASISNEMCVSFVFFSKGGVAAKMTVCSSRVIPELCYWRTSFFWLTGKLR